LRREWALKKGGFDRGKINPTGFQRGDRQTKNYYGWGGPSKKKEQKGTYKEIKVKKSSGLKLSQPAQSQWSFKKLTHAERN